ncbi:Integrin-linked protein kinase [Lamellibrachia satsuma]|nr:Integrin-linked protein kinase [Lamellibrachia satsuma]
MTSAVMVLGLVGCRPETRGDATLSRHSGIDIGQLNLQGRIVSTHSGDLWRGIWQSNDIVAKILNLSECTARNSRDFKEEYPRLRIFNHPNILPVLGACNQPPNLVVISQFMPFGSLYDVLHGETGIVVDQNQALRFSLDIARGMEFLHSLEPMIPNMYLNSKHVMIDEDLAKINVDDPKYQRQTEEGVIITGIDEDLTARISMADYKFSFHEKGKSYNPAWLAPEVPLLRRPSQARCGLQGNLQSRQLNKLLSMP